MRMTNRLLCLLIALMLVVPTAAAVPTIAFGQSAGDDQYVDPFQDSSGTGKNKGSGSGGSDNSGSNNSGSNNSGSDNSASQQSTGQSNTGDTAGTTAAQNSTDANNKLPRTGSDFPEGWLVAIGALLLLGGGFVLRRVWPRPD